jgi:DNA-binding MarR family transcriptional regulator
MSQNRQLVRTLLYLHQQLERAAVPLDMNMSHYFLLHFLHEEPRKASDFSVVSRIKKPGVTSIVTTLESRGWLERTTDPDDRRAQIIQITEEGKRAFLAFEDEMNDALSAFLGKQTVETANHQLDDFYQIWNEKRISRFQNWQDSRRPTGKKHDIQENQQ